MRASITTSILTCLFALALPQAGNATVEEPESATVSAPAPMTPEIPATPGKPHSSSYEPHGKLDPETQIQIALQHKREGRPQKALSTLDLAITSNPQSAHLYAVRGGILLEQGRIGSALADLEKAVKLSPDDAEVLTNRAQAYRRFGRKDLALADLDRAIEIQPDLIAARFNRGAVRYGTRDFDGALEDFDHCIANDPHLPGPYFDRAMAHNALGQRESGVKDLERFVQIEESENLRRRAEEVLELWRNPEKEKAVTEGVQPGTHR